MQLKVTVQLDDEEEIMLNTLDAWWEAMYASNGISSVNGYEKWAYMGEDCAYGMARKYYKELLYDLITPVEAADRLDDLCSDVCERPSVVLERNGKFIFTGERY